MQTEITWLPSRTADLSFSQIEDGEIGESLRVMTLTLDRLGAPRDIIDLAKLPRVPGAHRSSYDESESTRAHRAHRKLQLACTSPIRVEDTLELLENHKLWRRTDIDLPCLEDWRYIEEADQRKHRATAQHNVRSGERKVDQFVYSSAPRVEQKIILSRQQRSGEDTSEFEMGRRKTRFFFSEPKSARRKNELFSAKHSRYETPRADLSCSSPKNPDRFLHKL